MSEHEKAADIVQELRDTGARWCEEIADRIEQALERERDAWKKEAAAKHGLAADHASLKMRKDRWDWMCEAVMEEMRDSIMAHGEFNSTHEGYAVLLEEVEEYWDSVKRNRPDPRELVQIAAMALKALEGLGWLCFERIVCPKCGVVQKAMVTWREGDPFPTYLHECDRCEYMIMESEWNVVGKP